MGMEKGMEQGVKQGRKLGRNEESTKKKSVYTKNFLKKDFRNKKHRR